MPTSKKQLEKLNKVKKAKAEELSKQVALGSQSAKKKLKKLEKKLK
jgi:predicted ArsR family transcriptional regulator